MRRKIWLSVVVGSLMLAGTGFAGIQSKSVVIKANIPYREGLSVAISRVHKVNGEETSDPDTQISFNLQYNQEYHIFLADAYYVLDVGPETNASNWTLTYSAGNIVGPNGYILDDHINVVMVKQMPKNKWSLLKKCAYGECRYVTFTKSDLLGGWLRIYYGIATGDKEKDAPNVKVITTDVPAGIYSGTITVSLTTT